MRMLPGRNRDGETPLATVGVVLEAEYLIVPRYIVVRTFAAGPMAPELGNLPAPHFLKLGSSALSGESISFMWQKNSTPRVSINPLYTELGVLDGFSGTHDLQELLPRSRNWLGFCVHVQGPSVRRFELSASSGTSLF